SGEGRHPLPRALPGRAHPVPAHLRGEHGRRDRAPTLPPKGLPAVIHELKSAPPSAPAIPATAPPSATGAPRRRRSHGGGPAGEPFVWLTGAGLATSALMILGLLTLVIAQGAATFWPGPLVSL